MRRIWRNSYGRIFAAQPADAPAWDALRRPEAGSEVSQVRREGTASGKREPDLQEVGGLVFKWAPDMKGLIKPTENTMVIDSDAYAIRNGFVSVTPIRATFAEPP